MFTKNFFDRWGFYPKPDQAVAWEGSQQFVSAEEKIKSKGADLWILLLPETAENGLPSLRSLAGEREWEAVKTLSKEEILCLRGGLS